MRTSKYVNKTFGDWTCFGIGIKYSTSKRLSSGKKSKAPGAKHYEYEFIRPTSDGKCSKFITLDGNEMALVGKGKMTVEDICIRREVEGKSLPLLRQLSYTFTK